MMMPRVPNDQSRFNPSSKGGISRANYENSISRQRAGKPFVLTWKEKIYLRRMRNGETQAHIARALEVPPASISAALNAAARRFNVDTVAELRELDEVRRQLDGED